MNVIPLFAKKITCTVQSLVWLTSDVFQIRFEPNKKFAFDPGQFISIYVPNGTKHPARRAYSLSTPNREAGYELIVKKNEGGLGSTYLSNLRPGDSFTATAPYGEFRFESAPERRVCFIATGTGVAPFLSIARSEDFHTEHVPTLIFGARHPSDLLHSAFFEAAGFDTHYCLSQSIGHGPDFFSGRITDYLRNLPISYPFFATDFYLCGNGTMVNEVTDLLVNARGVSRSAIFAEAFSSATKLAVKTSQEAA